jgi:hypothetical protein
MGYVHAQPQSHPWRVPLNPAKPGRPQPLALPERQAPPARLFERWGDARPGESKPLIVLDGPETRATFAAWGAAVGIRDPDQYAAARGWPIGQVLAMAYDSLLAFPAERKRLAHEARALRRAEQAAAKAAQPSRKRPRALRRRILLGEPLGVGMGTCSHPRCPRKV